MVQILPSGNIGRLVAVLWTVTCVWLFVHTILLRNAPSHAVPFYRVDTVLCSWIPSMVCFISVGNSMGFAFEMKGTGFSPYIKDAKGMGFSP